jgi:hypothetical protein
MARGPNAGRTQTKRDLRARKSSVALIFKTVGMPIGKLLRVDKGLCTKRFYRPMMTRSRAGN